MNKKIGVLLVILCASIITRAQICRGSLGDPVINVNFGSGPNPGSPLSSVNYNYIYTSASCPADGNYTIVSSTASCFNNTWHILSEDHTPGDVNGYMMLVNATYTPGDFYTDTVKGLCPNTTYEFAAWILNVLKSTACGMFAIQPNLTFKIQTTTGIVLGSYNTGDIPQTSNPVWNQYGLFFTTPPNVSNIVLRLTNNAPGGCGNDLILDDITFRACGATVNAAINSSGATTADICEGGPQLFTLNANVTVGYLNPAYQWQVSTDSVRWKDIPGAITPSYNRNATGTGVYFYRMAVAEAGNIGNPACRVLSNMLTVRINANPVINASSNIPVCDQGPMNLLANDASQYSWTGPGGFTSSRPNPSSVATSNSNGVYYVKATSAKGCTAIDSVTIRVFPKASVEAGEDQHICEGAGVMLHASNAMSYLWSPAIGLSSSTVQNPIARPTDSTVYILNTKDVNGCPASDTLRVTVSKRPLAIAGAEVQMYKGQPAQLNGIVRGTNVTYLWSPSIYMTNANSLTPTIDPPESMYYWLTVSSHDSCGSSIDKVFVRVYQKVQPPNAFSPNGDGINDVWNIEKLQSYTNSVITVFNRYGQVVFKSTGYAKFWDGTFNNKPLPAGTYYYTIDLKNDTKISTGWVMIIR